LTLRAARLLGQANIVLHDALVTSEILAMISPAAKLIDIGKRCGHKLLTQAEINSLLISCATTAEIVIRLKGGDPCILGRAGEEIEALAEAGIAFEIVPGITSAIAEPQPRGFPSRTGALHRAWFLLPPTAAMARKPWSGTDSFRPTRRSPCTCPAATTAA
jgi:siroheme synthase